ncbi:CRISPR-associated endonuclease Cas2 [Pseudomonas sp. AN-1]|jgi:CRISPR-associated protein Cas2|uniref:CRISPR-associated endonuclease Cas2 n=1 Tax=Pseudomonas sp. AN-1 TaxID=3096605 RepID=UPI002A6AD6FD|nr:CRISPR-associated endonuclease Cas2 [Pseudomonas sp. AN-1]WPP46920.1 CRISPR-associated endonuclease Cas2 [Pseudomonas sp. AN-1]
MHNARNWYLISYDICHPRRLQRVHRLLRSQATALLESLFAFQGSLQALEQLRAALAREIRASEDDLLIYPLRTDRPMHRWGTACLPQGLYDFSLPPLVEHRESRIWMPHD